MRPTSFVALLSAVLSPALVGAQSPPDTASRPDTLTPLTAGIWIPLASTGNTRRMIDTSDFRRGAHPRTLSEILQARVPGVSVLRYGGDVSHGSRVRVRMPTGALGYAAPMLVVDGVPVSAPEKLGGSMVASSRFDDFEPEEIQRIDVLAGPTATTLFGSRASNGAVVVTTQRGATGRARIRAWSSVSRSTEPRQYPANYWMQGTSTAPGGRCDLEARALSQCLTPGALEVWNPLESVSPFSQGGGSAGGASVSGGPIGIAGLAAISARQESGVLEGSKASRLNARVNLERTFFDRVTVGARAGHVWRSATPPTLDPVALGLLGTARDDVNRGYVPLPGTTPPFFGGAGPAVDRTGNRFTRSGTIEARVLDWLTARAVVGRDELDQRDDNSDASTIRIRDDWQATSLGQGSLDARHEFRGASLRTLVSYEESRNRAFTYAESRTQTTPPLVASSSSLSWRSLRSWMLQERVSIQDRLFVNVGVRHMGPRVPWEDSWYPSVDVAWNAGARGPFSAFRFKGAVATAIPAADTSPVVFVPVFPPPPESPGREKTTEVELGAEMEMARRYAVDLTLVQQRTKGAFLTDFGGFPGSPLRADLLNRGLELAARAALADRRSLRLDAALALTLMSGKTEGEFPMFSSLGGFSVMPGAPYGVYIHRPVTFTDTANADGLPAPSEITVGPPEEGGPVFPTREIAGRFTLTLPGKGLSVALGVDHRGGHQAVNTHEYYQCFLSSTRNCRALQDPATPLDAQIRAVAAEYHGVPPMEDASFTRLGELAITWRSPAGLALRVEGRNLLTMTRFKGPDPEIQTANVQKSGLPQPGHGVPRILSVMVRYEPH
jgi:TonB-dependent SusC/RagA subfamily outer membrane receptor